MHLLMKDFIDRNEVPIVRDNDDFVCYLQQPGVNCVLDEDKDGKANGFILGWKFLMLSIEIPIPSVG